MLFCCRLRVHYGTVYGVLSKYEHLDYFSLLLCGFKFLPSIVQLLGQLFYWYFSTSLVNFVHLFMNSVFFYGFERAYLSFYSSAYIFADDREVNFKVKSSYL